MSSAPVTIDTDPPRTMASALADSLRGDIIKGVHAPGAKLAIKELCQRYDAGAIPMREALSRLATSGLVVAQDQRVHAQARGDAHVGRLLDACSGSSKGRARKTRYRSRAISRCQVRHHWQSAAEL